MRLRILDVPVDAVDMSASLEITRRLLQEDSKKGCILAVNPEKIIALQKKPPLKRMFEEAALLLPDGIGVVLGIWWLHGLKVSRVAGVDLMKNICKEAADKGYRIYIYGGHEEVNRKAVESLRTAYPGVRIVGRSNGYLTEEQMNHLIEEINNSRADILFVALGSPKQEEWIRKHLPELNARVFQGIGGTLDILAGETERAPHLFRRIGLEWLYRLAREPRRIRRQIACFVFALRVLMERSKCG